MEHILEVVVVQEQAALRGQLAHLEHQQQVAQQVQLVHLD
jgi:hypothetical protein